MLFSKLIQNSFLIKLVVRNGKGKTNSCQSLPATQTLCLLVVSNKLTLLSAKDCLMKMQKLQLIQVRQQIQVKTTLNSRINSNYTLIKNLQNLFLSLRLRLMFKNNNLKVPFKLSTNKMNNKYSGMTQLKLNTKNKPSYGTATLEMMMETLKLSFPINLTIAKSCT